MYGLQELHHTRASTVIPVGVKHASKTAHPAPLVWCACLCVCVCVFFFSELIFLDVESVQQTPSDWVYGKKDVYEMFFGLSKATVFVV